MRDISKRLDGLLDSGQGGCVVIDFDTVQISRVSELVKFLRKQLSGQVSSYRVGDIIFFSNIVPQAGGASFVFKCNECMWVDSKRCDLKFIVLISHNSLYQPPLSG